MKSSLPLGELESAAGGNRRGSCKQAVSELLLSSADGSYQRPLHEEALLLDDVQPICQEFLLLLSRRQALLHLHVPRQPKRRQLAGAPSCRMPMPSEEEEADLINFQLSRFVEISCEDRVAGLSRPQTD